MDALAEVDNTLAVFHDEMNVFLVAADSESEQRKRRVVGKALNGVIDERK